MKIKVRILVESYLYLFDRIFGKKTVIFVLSYHSFDEKEWLYDVSLNELDRQIRFLKDSGYQFINSKELFEIKQKKSLNNRKLVLLTIDDGYKSVIHAVKILKKYKIIPIIFLMSDPLDANKSELGRGGPFLNDEDIKNLHSEGFEFGSHSSTHQNLGKKKGKYLISEILDSKIKLEKKYGFEFPYFAFPRGQYSQKAIELVKKSGYKMAFTMNDGDVLSDSMFEIPRIGINKTHKINEFKMLYSPSVILMRKLVKKYILKIQP